MKEQRKVQQIRFKGFTNDWEQRKLSDFGIATGGTSIESEFSSNGKYKVISIGSYSENSNYNDQGIRAIHSDKTKTRVLNKEDLTMILNDKTASGRIIGRVLYIDKSGEYVYNQRTERIEINRELYNPKFIYHLLNAPEMRNKIIKQSQGNTQIFVNWNGIKNTEYLIPHLNEQARLEKIFANIDNLITLHQRKCDKLVEVKNSLLEKMFPKNSSKIPEIRFKGFTDDWEQRKLKDISSYRRGSFPQPYGKEEWYGGSQAMPFVQVADVNDDLKLNEETKQTISKLAQPMSVYIPKESVIVTLQGTIGKVAITQYNTYLDRTILYFDTYKIGNINKYFWALTIKNKFEEERKKAPGAVIKTITKEVLSEFNLNIPQHDEQEKIGMLFANIDNLITLHQRKLEKLKEVKKSMLEKMFV